MGGKILKLKSEELLEQGIERGVQQEKQETIVQMWEDNVPIETIARYVRVSSETVKKILGLAGLAVR